MSSPSTSSRNPCPCMPPPFEKSTSKSKQTRLSVKASSSHPFACPASPQSVDLCAIAAASRRRAPPAATRPRCIDKHHRAFRTSPDSRGKRRAEQVESVRGNHRERSLDRNFRHVHNTAFPPLGSQRRLQGRRVHDCHVGGGRHSG